MSYTSILIHYIFATSERRPLISDELQPQLWAYMGGIARTNGMKALAIGGMRDHVHLLLSLPATVTIAKAVQLIKAGSSKWMNNQKRTKWLRWQEEYGGFSIGVSQKEGTILYIHNQAQHHAKKSFDVELKMIMKRHGIVPSSTTRHSAALHAGLLSIAPAALGQFGRKGVSRAVLAYAPCQRHRSSG